MIPPPQVEILHCTLRVVRHGGWSWGLPPSEVARRATDLLPTLLARRLPGVLEEHGLPRVDAVNTGTGPDATEFREITEPVVVALRLSLTDLLSGRDVEAPAAPRPPAAPAAPTVAGGAAAQAPTPATTEYAASRLPDDVAPLSAPAYTSAGPGRDNDPPVTLLRADLARRAEHGELALLLGLLSEETLARWAELLTAPDTAPDGAVRAADALTPESVSPSPATTSPVGANHCGERLASRITTEVGASSPPSKTPDPRDLRTADPAALDPPTAPTETAAVPAQRADFDPAGDRRATTAPSPFGLPPSDADANAGVDIERALPFLVAAALHRTGQLACLGPAFASAGLTYDDIRLYAYAVACAVLRPLAPGEPRPSADTLSAAVFAGLSETPGNDNLRVLARRARPALDAVDAATALPLIVGHRPGQPLVLHRATPAQGGGLLLADPDGNFPLVWADGAAGLLPVWRACGLPVVVVPAEADEAGLVEELARSGVAVVTGVPPGRREHRRRLPHRGSTLWVAGPPCAPGRHARAWDAAQNTPVVLDQVLEELAVRRHILPRSTGSRAVRSVVLTAALGLGTLAWELWGTRLPTSPVLALDRLGDLSATVRLSARRIQIRLPLGQRREDLDRAGMLADIPSLPWLPQTTVTFRGG
ncbi:hypothetical protein ACFW93_32210 [Streptomyces canus]|uniref:hypothetical protein n=1 Tax=Streptomyces canus TaxID=58343 RepID=UPI0036BB2373